MASKTLPSGVYSFQQLEAIWIQAGGNPKLAPTMAAIAQAESGGNPNAHNNNPSTGDDSYGLWQINYFGANRAPRTARWGPPDAMYNPLANARAAVSLAGDSYKGLANWSTYSSGAFIPYYQKGTGSGVQQEGFGSNALKAIFTAPAQVFQGVTGKNVHASPTGPQSILGVIESPFQKIVAALILGGGALLTLLSVALIGADIGIDALNKSPVKKASSVIPAARVARVARGRKQRQAAERESAAREEESRQSRANRERREEERHQQSLKVQRARARELNTRQRHRKRTRQEQEAAERRAYIRGAADRE